MWHHRCVKVKMTVLSPPPQHPPSLTPCYFPVIFIVECKKMTTFASLSDARHQKHQLRPSPFSRCRTSFPAVSGRDPPKRGPPPHQLRHSLFLRKRQVEALHSSGVTGLYQYNNPRAKRDRRGTVQERGETETDRQTDRQTDRERENKNTFLCAGKSQQERKPPDPRRGRSFDLQAKDLMLYRLS